MKQISIQTYIYSPNVTIITTNIFSKYYCSKYLINEYLINIILVKYIHLNTLNILYLIIIILVKYIHLNTLNKNGNISIFEKVI
jgi:hypothetical protein